MEKVKKSKFEYKIKKNNKAENEIQKIIKKDYKNGETKKIKNIRDYSDERGQKFNIYIINVLQRRRRRKNKK